jgi:hypothetical protein
LTLREEEPARTSPEEVPRLSCISVDPGFPELTVLHLMSQSEINDLARDLNLPKIQAERLASRLQGWNLLQQGVKSVTHESPAIIVIMFI